jgi:hypothetical protein
MAVKTANRSRFPQADRTDLAQSARAAVAALPTCACGQALDTCRARCCPRCGIRVAALEPVRSTPHLPSYQAWSP